MAKCLRCGAGGEWIQGKVPKETKAEADTASLLEERKILARLAKSYEEPQFFNPLHAAAAIALRDRVLEKSTS